MPTLTITLTAGQATKFATVVAKELRLDQPATLEQCRQYVMNNMRQVVQQYDRRIAVAGITESTFDPT